MCILNIGTALLYINCFSSARIIGAFNFADIDRKQSGKLAFLFVYRESSVVCLFVCLFVCVCGGGGVRGRGASISLTLLHTVDE